MRLLALLALVPAPVLLLAHPHATKPLSLDKFRQLEEILPTPNPQRTASGAPGPAYWQQRADYSIDASLDETTHSITGRATLTYSNQSPDTLAYLWLQIDPRIFDRNSDNRATAPTPRSVPGALDLNKFHYRDLQAMLLLEDYESDFKISALTDAAGKTLPHTIVKTMLRVDLPAPLAPGQKTQLNFTWSYRINDAKLLPVRTGLEFFPEDKNHIYEIAQWFPRMAAYTDTTGWQHKQYLGRGEFALEFGNYDVRLTVPADHVVSATGILQNPAEVLTAAQRDRLATAEKTTDKITFIITPEEAKTAEKAKSTATKTWHFRAENVRDFAFASSRKFIWDAMAVPSQTWKDGAATRPVLAMSLYPNEAEPLWSKYSTHAIAHALEVYSYHTFPYPYPVAISVNGPIFGMEYPMICFNGPRPEKDGTYTAKTKYALISVIIHEVGHNYFPMIVNTDERQWNWLDEGLNSFLQYLAEQSWENKYPSNRGEPRDIIAYMTSPDQVPIMTASDSIARMGDNAYGKPATALNVLRETVLGRDLFDHAFRTYAQRWMFKRPYPVDFFRTMEDAAGTDLDWFWRGWFYSNDHCDLAITQVRRLVLDTRDPAIEKPLAKKEKDERPATLSAQRNAALPKRTDKFPELLDFYNTFDEAAPLPSDTEAYDKLLKDLTKEEIPAELLKTNRNFYAIDFQNLGGLVMPVSLKITYTDDSVEEHRLPAELWRMSTPQVTKLIATNKELKSIVLDPNEETADADVENNFWPRRLVKTPLKLWKDDKKDNPMQEQNKAADKAAKVAADKATPAESKPGPAEEKK